MDENKDIIVPCGKCDGCRLHKANEWMLRVANEIESSTYSIFFTLTYSNKYLPCLYPGKTKESLTEYYSDCFKNIRYNGSKDVRRNDNIHIDWHCSYPIQNGRSDLIPYASKRDIQLYLKLIRKDIDVIFKDYDYKSRFIRYYIISEYGPTTHRPHYHGILFCENYEVSQYLLYVGLYKSWQMCDKDLFDQYTRYCNTETAGYVTQYITSVNHLPKIYQVESVRPFRLASKSPSIGFSAFDRFDVAEKVSSGVIEYIKEVARLESKSVLRFPKNYMRSLFPRCYKYRLLTSRRIYEIYSACWLDARRRKTENDSVVDFARLRAFMHPMNYNASLACYKFCQLYEKITGDICTPDYYLYCLDMYYYKADMYALECFYTNMKDMSPIDIAYQYDNFGYLVTYRRSGTPLDNALEVFLYSLGLQNCDWDLLNRYQKMFRRDIPDSYVEEVSDILENCAKVPKFNEKYGFAPHIV